MKALTPAVAAFAVLALAASPDARADLKVKGKIEQVETASEKAENPPGNEKSAPKEGFPRIRLGTLSQGAVVGVEDELFLDDFADDELTPRAKTEIGVISNSIVSGKVRQTVTVDDSANIARGAGSTAITRIGVVRNSIVSGTVDQTTHVGSSVNVAAGGGTATTHIGVIDGSSVNGEVDQSVFVDRVRNIAD